MVPLGCRPPCEMTEDNKIKLNKVICTQCKASLLIRPAEKRCPVCGALLPHADERNWRGSFTLFANGMKMWIFIRAKACPKCGGIERHRLRRSFRCAFYLEADTIFVSTVRWSFSLCLISSRSTCHLARLPSPHVRVRSHSPSSLLSLLFASTLKWYFS